MLFTKKKMVSIVAITFALKLVLALYFSHLLFCQYPTLQWGIIAKDGGDTFSYLGVMDNLLAHGEYYFWNGAQKVYAGRMPYYGALYFLLRLFFEQKVAYDVYAVLQIALDAFATVVFAQLCFEIFRKKVFFWVGFLLYFCSFNIFMFSIDLWTESPSLSFLIFFLFFYHRFRLGKKLPDALWASVFLALMTVLKPYFVLIYPVFFLSVWFVLNRKLSAIYKVTLLGLPLLILLSPWIVRNFVSLGKFIPAQEGMYASYNYSKSYYAFVDFAGAWGGGIVFWEPDDAGCYFLVHVGFQCRYSLPDYALANGYSREKVEDVRQKFLELQKNYSPELDEAVATEFQRLTEIYRREKPFMYHIGARFIFFKKFFLHKNLYNLPIHTGFNCYGRYQELFKVIQFGIYALALTFGTFLLIKQVYKRKLSYMFVAIPLIITIFFIAFRTHTEPRYVAHVYPFLLIGLSVFLVSVIEQLQTFWIKSFR